jgi:fatty-acyl-CoA synthase
MLNLARLHEAISDRIPDRECIVFRDRHLSYREVTERTRRLASVLRSHGLGCHHERAVLRPWESGQDHVALYLYNGNEYLEGMLGAFKARTVPFNVNYRYVDDELLYLFSNAEARAVVFHAGFAPVLRRIRDRIPEVALWLEVDDGSDEHLEGALPYEEALASAEPTAPTRLSPDDLYMLYTGGTTGLPKGVLWRQEDIFLGALAPGTVSSLDDVVERAERGGPRMLTTPPFMHGAAHWAAFGAFHAGGTVIVPDSHEGRLDPEGVWHLLEREKATALTIVGDAFGRPLLDSLSRGAHDVSSLRLLNNGGAILSPELKKRFLDAIPGLRLRDNLGSSESGAQATQDVRAGQPVQSGDFELQQQSVVLTESLDGVLPPGDERIGWLARAGHVPLGYLGDPEKTERTFPTIDGVRYSVPGDRARRDTNGRLVLLGRDSVTINTGGEKVFAEEVETALKVHPAVYDAIVIGLPHERWGQQITAVVQLAKGQEATPESLRETVRAHLAPYKLPKAFVFVTEVIRSPSGKADYRWAREAALDGLAS